MRRRDFFAAILCAAALDSVAGRTQPLKLPVIGVLVASTPDPEPALRRFRQGLNQLGYIEGQTIQIDVRSPAGNAERLPQLADDLVRAKVDVIAAWLTPAVLAAKHATSEIPIVMIGAADPVGVGLVASLARPGGNITGLAGQTAELAGKQVELLKEPLPKLSRIAALCSAPDAFSRLFLKHIKAGYLTKIEVMPITVAAIRELDAAFVTVSERVEAIVVQPSLPLQHVADLALRYRIPAAAPLEPFAQAGGLLAYANKADFNHRAAVFVDKILKGAKPADLPVEQPTRFELIINMKTAKALGLTIPPALLARADQLIE